MSSRFSQRRRERGAAALEVAGVAPLVIFGALVALQFVGQQAEKDLGVAQDRQVGIDEHPHQSPLQVEDAEPGARGGGQAFRQRGDGRLRARR